MNLRSLEIATFPDATLAPLAGLVRLESLGILDMRRISDLSPLRGLNALTRLSLATPPSWDSSGKVIEIHSLAPLNDLPLLADLELFGVCPPSGRVDDLMAIASLRHVRLSKYPRSEIERLYREVARRTELDG